MGVFLLCSTKEFFRRPRHLLIEIFIRSVNLFPPCFAVGLTDFIVKGFDSSLEVDSALAVQYGGSQNDTVTAIVADEVSTDLVVVGSTYSEDGDDHLFGLSTPSMFVFFPVFGEHVAALQQAT